MDASNPTHARTLWFTGLSGAGKTTLAEAIATRLRAEGHPSVVLDGDILRKTISADLGFGSSDRDQHIERVRGLAAVLQAQGLWVCVACITPFEAQRRLNRQHLVEYVEVYVRCPLELCIARDPKGLYARARRGEIKAFTGLSHPYETPRTADVLLDTSLHNVDDCVAHLWHHINPSLSDTSDDSGIPS